MSIALTVQVSPASILALNQTLDRYIELSRKTPAEALDRQGREMSIHLYQSFLGVTPKRGEIGASAEARGFAVGRRKFGGKLSPESYRLAESIMFGQPVVWGRVERSVGAFGLLRTVRVGKRGKRITGGRRATGGRAASFDEGKALKIEGEHPLNRQAVATFYELQKREAGRRYLASSFLLFRKRRNTAERRRAGESYRIVRQSTARTSFPWRKEAQLVESPDGGRFELIAGAEGVTKYPRLVAAGIEATRKNMLVYIDRKTAEAIARAEKRKVGAS